MWQRVLTPELLDRLPSEHPDALRSRRDLRLINFFLGGERWIHDQLAAHPDQKVVELGAGEGTLALSGQTDFRGHWTACDLRSAPPAWPPAWTWKEGDFFETLAGLRGEALVGNLILHHFDRDELAILGKEFQRFSRLFFHEPLRRPRTASLSRLLYLFGLNRVTRHDMRVSIEAGFRGLELPEWLGLDEARWSLTLSETLLGGYRLSALQKAL
ncbi:MAG: hypothetical protein AAF555_08145 [Verrucomicrobiota bacterium]